MRPENQIQAALIPYLATLEIVRDRLRIERADNRVGRHRRHEEHDDQGERANRPDGAEYVGAVAGRQGSLEAGARFHDNPGIVMTAAPAFRGGPFLTDRLVASYFALTLALKLLISVSNLWPSSTTSTTVRA